MNIVIAFIITIAVISLIARLYFVNDKMIQFFSKGLDSDFKFSEICSLWSLAKKTNLEDPLSLYISVNVMNNCIAQIINDAKASGTQNSFKTQQLLTKLYKYRTRIALDSDGKHGIETTTSIDVGQKLRVILSGKGVFASRVLSNGSSLIISLPRQEDKKNHRFIVLEKEIWKEHIVPVYFWRKGDAGYAFDSRVFEVGSYQGQDCLFLEHSSKLTRTQKRQSVRAPCNIYAQMYFIKENIVDYNSVNTDNGFRCLLEDISEDGALIRVGGSGKSNVRIKLQFDLNGSFIMMYGVVRGVEYNKDIEQSRLHFECTHIDATMKNAILAFVYNVLPENEKEINEAMAESENDEKEDEMEQMVTGRSEEKSGANVVVSTTDEIPSDTASSSQPTDSESQGSSFFGMGGVESIATQAGANGSMGSGISSLPMNSIPEASNLDVMPGDMPQPDSEKPKTSTDSSGL